MDELLDCEVKDLPSQEACVNSVHRIMSHVKPFMDQELNRKIFDKILEKIVDPSTRPSLSLPALFVVSALIRNESDALLATRMSTRYIDALCRMVSFSKVISL